MLHNILSSGTREKNVFFSTERVKVMSLHLITSYSGSVVTPLHGTRSRRSPTFLVANSSGDLLILWLCSLVNHGSFWKAWPSFSSLKGPDSPTHSDHCSRCLLLGFVSPAALSFSLFLRVSSLSFFHATYFV